LGAAQAASPISAATADDLAQCVFMGRIVHQLITR
jgi:hypothetical protein